MTTLDIKLRSSGPSPQTPSPQILQQAAEWFVLLRSGEATEDDRNNWRNWLEQDPAHKHAWGYVESISRRFEPVQAENRKDAAVAAFHNARSKLIKRRQILNGIALVAGGGFLSWVASRHELVPDAVLAWNADYRSTTGEIREVAMTDGTRIWLNTASAFNADYQPSLRRVHLLEGEILIQTAADTTRPFVVDSKHGRMRALGTRFTVRQDEQLTHLTVFEGAVEINTTQTGASSIITASQQVSFNAADITEPATADAARQAWSRHILLAENLPLRDLISELNRYHHGYLHVAPEVADLRVLGGYPLDDRDKVLRMLEEVLPIRIKRTLPWWITIEASNISS